MQSPELALEFAKTTLEIMNSREEDSVNTALVFYVMICKLFKIDLQNAIKILVEDFDNINPVIDESQGDASNIKH